MKRPDAAHEITIFAKHFRREISHVFQCKFAVKDANPLFKQLEAMPHGTPLKPLQHVTGGGVGVNVASFDSMTYRQSRQGGRGKLHTDRNIGMMIAIVTA